MARGSFLGRIGRAIRNVFAPSPRSQPPEQPTEPPGRGGPPIRDRYRDEWVRQGGTGSYQQNLAVFHRLVDPVESDPDEQFELWESYVRHINLGEGNARRNSTSNMFWRDSGLDPTDFDWANWRLAMGYTGTHRSRTP